MNSIDSAGLAAAALYWFQFKHSTLMPRDEHRWLLPSEGVVMRTTRIYRIYTEAKNKREIVLLTGKHFESFTLQPTIGYYRGTPEKSIVIEIVGATEPEIRQLAQRIQKMNGQKSVLMTRLPGKAKTVRI
jgi:hypothetical protein